jgi:molybdenum cofactor cytidylyltransferase
MASGFSNRMGTNKLLLTYKGKTLIENILDKIIQCGFYDIILVAQDKKILDLGNSRGIQCVYNEKAALGQSESIKLGVVNSKEAEGYAFFTGDQPLMDVRTIKFLMDCFYKAKNSIIVPIANEKRGTPVIFPNRFKAELLALRGDTGGKQIIARHMDESKFIEINSDLLLFDIDTQEDYKELLLTDDK